MLSMSKEFKGKWRLCDCPHKCCQCRRSLRVSGDCVTVPTNVCQCRRSLRVSGDCVTVPTNFVNVEGV